MPYLDDIGFQNWAASRGATQYNDGDRDRGLVHADQTKGGLDPGKVQSGEYEKEIRDSYAISESTDAQGRKRFGSEGTQFGDSGAFFDDDRTTAVAGARGRQGVRVSDDADEMSTERMGKNTRQVFNAYKASGRELGWYDDRWGYQSDPDFYRDISTARGADSGEWTDMLPMVFMAVVTAGVASFAAAGAAAAEGGALAGGAAAGEGVGATAGAASGAVGSASPFSSLYSEALAGTGPFAQGAAVGANVSPFSNLYSEAANGVGPFAQSPSGIISQVQGAPQTPAAGDFSQSLNPGPLDAPPTGLPNQLPPPGGELAPTAIENPISPSLLNPELAPQIPLAPNVDPSTGLMGGAANNAPPSLFERLTDAAQRAPTSARNFIRDNPGTALTAASLLTGGGGGSEEPERPTTPAPTPFDQDLDDINVGVRRGNRGLTDLQGRPIFNPNTGRLNTGIVTRTRAA
jgi:hypothetical protein